MMIEWLTYAVAGSFAGLLAGLFGAGGGVIIVPLLSSIFLAQALPMQLVVHLAIGTSLATIIFTSLASLRAHHRRGAVRWDALWRLVPGIAAGALLGAVVAKWLGGEGLRLAFALFQFIVAAQLLLNWQPANIMHNQLRPNFWAGSIIGGISSVVGIGGGTLSVPFLLWCRLSMYQAVGTAAALGMPIALSGTIGFILTGWHEENLPPYSLGYIYLPALLGIVIFSTLTAPWGAKIAHSLPGERLRRIFGGLLVLMGIKMLSGW